MGRRLTVRETILGYLQSFSSGDPARIAAFVADDFENIHCSALGSNSSGRAEYLARLPSFLAQFTDLSYAAEDVVVENDKAAVAYLLRAVDNGTPIEIRGAMHFTIVGDLIARRVDYWDSLTYLRQVGEASDGPADS